MSYTKREVNRMLDKWNPLTYEAAETYLESGRNQRERTLENNTDLVRRFGGDTQYFAVRLHTTDVVDIYPDNTYTIRTGGWQSQTTKNRINRYSPIRVTQENYTWYFVPLGGAWEDRIEFESGMRFDRQGRLLGQRETRRKVAGQYRRV